MALIFDQFPSRADAERFAAEVQQRFGLTGCVFDDAEDARAADPFPFELVAPIVHVERPDIDDVQDRALEAQVTESVANNGGTFAGT